MWMDPQPEGQSNTICLVFVLTMSSSLHPHTPLPATTKLSSHQVPSLIGLTKKVKE